jgi:hypothetical protein
MPPGRILYDLDLGRPMGPDLFRYANAIVGIHSSVRDVRRRGVPSLADRALDDRRTAGPSHGPLERRAPADRLPGL